MYYLYAHSSPSSLNPYLLTNNEVSLYVSTYYLLNRLSEFSQFAWSIEHEKPNDRGTLLATFDNLQTFAQTYPELLI